MGGITCFSASAASGSDLAANTVVVRQLPVKEPDLDQLALAKFNSLREYGHLAARRCASGYRRGRPASRSRRCSAANRSTPKARVALSAKSPRTSNPLVVFPPEAVETMTDEQYLHQTWWTFSSARESDELILKGFAAPWRLHIQNNEWMFPAIPTDERNLVDAALGGDAGELLRNFSTAIIP